MTERVTMLTNRRASRLIGASFIALSVGAALPAWAQDTSPAQQQTPPPGDATNLPPTSPQSQRGAGVPEGEAQTDDIVVTGFRASLNAAIAEKREAIGIVDVIKAEDIADFPDNNLAESIQRIPGVAINRDQGEGRNITVRGLGPVFTRVRINGIEGLSTTGGRTRRAAPTVAAHSISMCLRPNCSTRSRYVNRLRRMSRKARLVPPSICRLRGRWITRMISRLPVRRRWV